MIYNIWIIDSSGLCIFYRSYGGYRTDPHLISGFFTAIYNFAREVGGDRLETISMQDTAFTFLVSKNILFVVASDDKTGREGKELLETIEKEFFKRFEKKLVLFSDMLRETPEVLAFQHFVDAMVEKINARPTVLLEVQFEKDYENIYPKRICTTIELLKRGSKIREDIMKKYGLEGLDVLSIADGTRNILEIAEIVGLTPTKVFEIVEYARRNGWVTMRSVGKAEVSSVIESFLRREISIKEAEEKLSRVFGRKVDEETLMKLIGPVKKLERERTDLTTASQMKSIKGRNKIFKIATLVMTIGVILIIFLLLIKYFSSFFLLK